MCIVICSGSDLNMPVTNDVNFACIHVKGSVSSNILSLLRWVILSLIKILKYDYFLTEFPVELNLHSDGKDSCLYTDRWMFMSCVSSSHLFIFMPKPISLAIFILK